MLLPNRLTGWWEVGIRFIKHQRRCLYPGVKSSPVNFHDCSVLIDLSPRWGDETMHRHHFLVDEYIGHLIHVLILGLWFESPSWLHCIDAYTGFSPGFFSQESELEWQNVGLESWRFCQNCDWQANISGVAFYYLATQQKNTKKTKKLPKREDFNILWLGFNAKYN